MARKRCWQSITNVKLALLLSPQGLMHVHNKLVDPLYSMKENWKKNRRGTPCGATTTVLGSRWIHCYAICWKMFKMRNPRYCIFLKRSNICYIHIPSLLCCAFCFNFGSSFVGWYIAKWNRTNLWEAACYVAGKSRALLAQQCNAPALC